MRADDVMKSTSGKSLRVKIGEKWYGADLESGIQKGSTFDAEVTTGKFGPWLQGVKLGAPSPSVTLPGTITTGAPTVAPFWMPFASNVVAHAISAGVIKIPDELKSWVFAAKQAAESAASDDVNA